MDQTGVPPARNGGLGKIEYLYRFLSRFANAILIVTLIGIVVAIGVGVVGRTSGLFLFVGTEELTRLLLAWSVLVYLGASYRGKTFIRMRAIYGVVPERARLVIEVIERVILLWFCWLLLRSGASWTLFQHSIGRRSITSLGTPAWIQTLAIPVGAVMLALATLSRSPRESAKDEMPDTEAF